MNYKCCLIIFAPFYFFIFFFFRSLVSLTVHNFSFFFSLLAGSNRGRAGEALRQNFGYIQIHSW